MAAQGLFAGDGGDPRRPSVLSNLAPSALAIPSRDGKVRPQDRRGHDPSVSFHEYRHYARLTRAHENIVNTYNPEDGILEALFPAISARSVPDVPDSLKATKSLEQSSSSGTEDEKAILPRSARMSVTDEEWKNASRATRTASWAAIFYLITTDILGPFGVPYAIGTLGWGPGVALYTVFGIMSAYSGWLLWQCFMGLDSYEYPLKAYGTLAFRLYGPKLRKFINPLQSIQLIANVAVIIVGNGQALSQMTKFNLCYVVCLIIFTACGFVLGQIRTLQKFGWLANIAIFLNLLVIFITMGVAAHSDPNYYAAQSNSAGATTGVSVAQLADGSFPPVQHSGNLPNSKDFVGAVSGLMQAVYAYGGALIFTEFMAEMRHPNDFLKALFAAETFIYISYLIYGLVMYHYQGQYAVNPSYLGLGPYAWQLVADIIAVASAMIAAALYSNIGIKVIYNDVLVELFNFPPLDQQAGKYLWIFFCPIYWALAFVFGASVPNFNGLTGVIAAFCIFQFTYTFPPLLHLGYAIQEGAILPGEGFDPVTGTVTQHDSGWVRIKRGFCTKTWYINVWNVIYFLGALATAGLGAYSSIELLKAAYENSAGTSFTCKSPLNDQPLGSIPSKRSLGVFC